MAGRPRLEPLSRTRVIGAPQRSPTDSVRSMEGTGVLPRTNLPAELSSFVGRRHELAQVKQALTDHRLVTLLGPGGVGKTRLAYRVAADLVKRYADGCWVVELATVHDPALVDGTVLASLGVREAGSGAPRAQLVEHLRDRELLLVLDNCEHIQDTASALVGELLGACPGLSVVATTRHALEVPGELIQQVPPLAVPAGDRDSGSPDGLLAYDSVRLFVDRATASWSQFEVTATNQGAVAELVRRLDGVPLAIELASVRVRSLSVEQILARLADRFALLTRGSRAAEPRQQTLAALIGWSHDLLAPEERLLWQRLTVFSGTFDVEGVRAVACTDDLGCEHVEPLLAGLVSKSILVHEPGVDGSAGRYHLLESIMEFGRARLDESGSTEEFRRRHRAHYAELARRSMRERYGPDGVLWFRRLRADHENLRAALDCCVSQPDLAAAGLEMMGDLQHHWVMVGRFGEARHWLDRLLALPASGPSGSRARAAGLAVAGRLAVLQGDVARARTLLDEADREATEVGDPTWLGHVQHARALSTIFWGEPADAVAPLEGALELHRGGDDPFGVPLAQVQLATVHATLGDARRAMSYAEECIAASEQVGEQWCAGLARWTQALVAWREGRVTRARSHARDALRLKEPFGARMGMAMAMEMVAWTLSVEGRHEQTATLLGAVEVALDSVGGSLFGHLLEDHESCLSRTREALGEQEYAAAASAGAALPFHDAVVLALGRRSGTSRPRDRAGDESAVRLTRREREIAGLLAQGLSNREIAETLVMAQRTAEGHVARILGKLGLSSRDQVAAWMHEQAG